jgi:alkanesulfonate monooxygenase SsuD/methylene tetrahydromethanopterin reductase-like flavin-dependent oxidoreductase (luciferase family)
MAVSSPVHIAVALDGAGWHPGAWREPRARPADLLSAGYWADLIVAAERGLLDFVTIEDGLGLHAAPQAGLGADTKHVRGHLDAVLLAARIAPLTRYIGLIPTVVVTHTEPFHISKAIATLDYVSAGRAGVRVRVSADPREAAHFGRRTFPRVRPQDHSDPQVRRLVSELIGEAGDYVEVLRRLWDSWEDDAEIRDAATGRFIDRHKLHYINFAGGQFNVKGPSITPRPPQGQPVVAALAHNTATYRLVGRSADIGFVTPRDDSHARSIAAEIRAAQEGAGRGAETVHVFADLVVFLDERPGAALARKARLDELMGGEYASDAMVWAGTAAELADRLQDWQTQGVSGFRLRPGVLPDDLQAVTAGLVPELQRRGAFRTAYESRTLRVRLGLPRPASRYAVPGPAVRS